MVQRFSSCISISVCLSPTSSLHMLSPFREEDDDEYCFVSRGQGLGASVDCQVFNCLDLDDLGERGRAMHSVSGGLDHFSR